MTFTLVENLTTAFSLSEDELIQEGIKAFLLNQLHLVEVERRKIFTHHDVRTLDEFDQILINNPDKESDLLESYQRADYLTHRIDEISQWIRELNGNGQS
jgi:hypothetical protein